MTFDARYLHDRLVEFRSVGGKPGRYLVAFSGGVDSTVLLHALVSVPQRNHIPVLAIHIDHGLLPESSQWAAFCRRMAGELGVEFLSRKVAINPASDVGPEAAAREARYAVLGSLMQPSDWLLSGHHENDQAETLLLNLLRGSSLAGLAGMGAIREFPPGFLVRPLLGVPGGALRDYADQHELTWCDDPSNADTDFDRNFLRQEIMPMLAARWPAVTARLRQSADLAAEASELLNELADIDIARSPSADRLDIRSLVPLSPQRQRNVIRRAVRRCGLPAAPATRLYQVVHELIPAREDAQPLVAWPGGEIRRYRDHLYILTPQDPQESGPATLLFPDSTVHLGSGQGSLTLRRQADAGIDPAVAGRGLAVRYREGGEEITLPGQQHRRKLKKMLQDQGIVPWMRDRLPLLYAGDQLVAVADLWVDRKFTCPEGYALCWTERPALY